MAAYYSSISNDASATTSEGASRCGPGGVPATPPSSTGEARKFELQNLEVAEDFAIFPDGDKPYTLGPKGRFAVVQLFNGNVYVSIRECFKSLGKDGFNYWKPSTKGIHLRVDNR